MIEIKYLSPIKYGGWGRNGVFTQSGLDLAPVGDEIFIQGITGKGQVSEAARLVVPKAQIPAVIEGLEKLNTSSVTPTSLLRELLNDWPEFGTDEPVNGAELVEYVGELVGRVKAVLR